MNRQMIWRGRWVFVLAAILALSAAIVTARPVLRAYPGFETVAYIEVAHGPGFIIGAGSFKTALPAEVTVTTESPYTVSVRSNSTPAELREILKPVLSAQAATTAEVIAQYESRIAQLNADATKLRAAIPAGSTSEDWSKRLAAIELVSLQIQTQKLKITPPSILSVEQKRLPRTERLSNLLVSALAALYVAGVIAVAFGYATDRSSRRRAARDHKTTSNVEESAL